MPSYTIRAVTLAQPVGFQSMRASLVPFLRCPSCHSENAFEISATTEDAYEIVDGALQCTQCEAVYGIREGYCDLLGEPSASVQREQAAQARAETSGNADMPLPEEPEARREAILDLPSGHPHSEEHAPVMAYAMKHLHLSSDASVLDLGAGIAWTTAEFARRGCSAVALDIYANVLACTRTYVAEGIFFERVLGDMTTLPFARERFDVVFANAAIHHSPDLRMTLSEAARVLKQAGTVVFVNEPAVGRFQHRRRKAFGMKEKAEGFGEATYSTQEWRQAFYEAGLVPHFEIPDAGVEAKIRRRRQEGVHASIPGRIAMAALSRRPVRYLVLSALGSLVREFTPFNVVMWGRKME